LKEAASRARNNQGSPCAAQVAKKNAQLLAKAENLLSRQYTGRLGCAWHISLAGFVLQIAFGLIPELLVPAVRPMVALPDFLGALADLIFGRLSHGSAFLE
jgi:hypothetical protein